MGWICPVCGAGVAPSQETHCVGAEEAQPHIASAQLVADAAVRLASADVVALGSKTKTTARKRQSYTDPSFDEFWDVYPLKLDKRKAFDAWRNAVAQGTQTQSIIAGAMRYAKWCRVNATEARHIKYAQGWLNGERWNDVLPLPAEVGEGPSFAEQEARRIAEEERAIKEMA